MKFIAKRLGITYQWNRGIPSQSSSSQRVQLQRSTKLTLTVKAGPQILVSTSWLGREGEKISSPGRWPPWGTDSLMRASETCERWDRDQLTDKRLLRPEALCVALLGHWLRKIEMISSVSSSEEKEKEGVERPFVCSFSTQARLFPLYWWDVNGIRTSQVEKPLSFEMMVLLTELILNSWSWKDGCCDWEIMGVRKRLRSSSRESNEATPRTDCLPSEGFFLEERMFLNFLGSNENESGE